MISSQELTRNQTSENVTSNDPEYNVIADFSGFIVKIGFELLVFIIAVIIIVVGIRILL